MKKSKPYDKLCRAAYDATMTFYKEELWEYYPGDSAVAFKIPGMEAPVIALIMGQAGEQFGLHISYGEDAWDSLCALMDENRVSADEAQNNIHMTGFSIDPLHEIPPEFRSVLNRAKIQARRENRVPFFLTKEPHRGIRIPNNRELKMCLLVTNGMIKAHSEGKLDPRYPLDNNSLQLITVSGDPKDYSISYDEYTFSDEPSLKIIRIINVPKNLEKLKHRSEKFLVSFTNTPIHIVDDDIVLSLFCIIDDASQFILEGTLLASSETAEAAEFLLEVLCGKNSGGWKGLPAEITFANRAVMDHAAPHLEPLGVNCTFQADHPMIDHIKDDLIRYISDNIDYGENE